MALELKQTRKVPILNTGNPRRVQVNQRRQIPGQGHGHYWAGLKRGLSWVGTISLGMVFFALLSLILFAGYRVVIGGTIFSLNTVEIQGNFRLSKQEIIKQAGVALGQNSLEMDLEEIKERLLANPWVKEVSVKRVLPGAFSVVLTEKQPVFLLNEKETLFYADDKGIRIAPVQADGFVTLPHLLIERVDQRTLDKLPGVIKELSDSGLFKISEASWIKFGAIEGLEIYFSQMNLRIHLDNDGLTEQLDKIDQIWADLSRRKELGAVRRIQAIGGNVWVDFGRNI